MTVKVYDATAECFDGRYTRVDSNEQSIIWIHRIGPSVGTTAAQIARFFVSGKGVSYTGGNMPYTYVNTDERVEQALPLDERGAHARRWGNTHGVGFAQVGDFNKKAPHAAQWERAVDVCADLLPSLTMHSLKGEAFIPWHLRRTIPVFGHGEVPAAYGSASGKQQPNGPYACPGRYWSMDEFREDVKLELERRAAARLKALGHRFTGHKDPGEEQPPPGLLC